MDSLNNEDKPTLDGENFTQTPPEPTDLENKPQVNEGERLIGVTENILHEFITSGLRSKQRLEEGYGDLMTGGSYLDRTLEVAEISQSGLRRTGNEGAETGEVMHLLGNVRRRLEDQIEQIRSNFSESSRGYQFIGDLESKLRSWERGGVDEFIEQLRIANQEEDPNIRSERIEALSVQIDDLVIPLDAQAHSLSSEVSGVAENIPQNVGSVVRDARTAYSMAVNLRELLGDSFYRITGNIGEIEEMAMASGGKISDSAATIPHELRVISEAALRLRVDIFSLLEMIKDHKDGEKIEER